MKPKPLTTSSLLAPAVAAALFAIGCDEGGDGPDLRALGQAVGAKAAGGSDRSYVAEIETLATGDTSPVVKSLASRVRGDIQFADAAIVLVDGPAQETAPGEPGLLSMESEAINLLNRITALGGTVAGTTSVAQTLETGVEAYIRGAEQLEAKGQQIRGDGEWSPGIGEVDETGPHADNAEAYQRYVTERTQLADRTFPGMEQLQASLEDLRNQAESLQSEIDDLAAQRSEAQQAAGRAEQQAIEQQGDDALASRRRATDAANEAATILADLESKQNDLVLLQAQINLVEQRLENVEVVATGVAERADAVLASLDARDGARLMASDLRRDASRSMEEGGVGDLMSRLQTLQQEIQALRDEASSGFVSAFDSYTTAASTASSAISSLRSSNRPTANLATSALQTNQTLANLRASQTRRYIGDLSANRASVQLALMQAALSAEAAGGDMPDGLDTMADDAASSVTSALNDAAADFDEALTILDGINSREQGTRRAVVFERYAALLGLQSVAQLADRAEGLDIARPDGVPTLDDVRSRISELVSEAAEQNVTIPGAAASADGGRLTDEPTDPADIEPAADDVSE
jgi:prefoldin subunit 5